MPSTIPEKLAVFVIFVLSGTVHEFSHAWVAFRLGDDTAARAGRLTLNPIAHIDLFGTVIIPLAMLLSGLMPLGWMQTPVDPSKFRRGVKPATGDALVSVAGPISNLALALFSAVLLGVFSRFAPELVAQGTPGGSVLIWFLILNVLLALLNLLPLPPLDGSALVGLLLPHDLRAAWNGLRAFGPILLIALLWIPVGPGGQPILWYVLDPAQAYVTKLLLVVSVGIAA